MSLIQTPCRSLFWTRIQHWSLSRRLLYATALLLLVSGFFQMAQAQNTTGTFFIVNAESAKCLDVANASVKAGENVNQFPCHGGDNQVWHFVRPFPTQTYPIHYQLMNENSGMCLTVSPRWNRVRAQQQPCESPSHQQSFKDQLFVLSPLATPGNNDSQLVQIEGYFSSGCLRADHFAQGSNHVTWLPDNPQYCQDDDTFEIWMLLPDFR